MKRLILFALYTQTSEYLNEQLNSIFCDLIEIASYSIENDYSVSAVDGDIVLITTPSILNLVRKKVKDGVPIVSMRRTLTVDAFNKLKRIPSKSKVLLVNSTLDTALETIAQIYQLGITEIYFIPFAPQMSNIPNDVSIAVTPGETKFVPKKIKNVIDIGNRVIDLSTLFDVTAKLELDPDVVGKILNNYMQEILPLSYGLLYVLRQHEIVKRQLFSVLNLLSVGIIITDEQGTVVEFNQYAEKMTGLRRQNVINQFVHSLFPRVNLPSKITKWKYYKSNIYEIDGKKVSITNYPIKYMDDMIGVVCLLEEPDVEKNRKGNTHTAKYSFSDIIGEDEGFKKVKKAALKISTCDLPVLITGETGTGKEMFAQAIHEASLRRNGPFVVVDCSTLTTHLMDSELFGYVEGAFTGAKKSGKQGFFEIANGGTIFLDEIGELTTEAQAKLLRVLEEKEIRRVGGTEKISVDIRVIAATNINVLEYISQKKFREDLYYRLNAFPLHILPLRERKSDIPMLVSKFLKENNYKKEISKQVLEALIKYEWPGNVRELKNCIEFAVHLSDGNIIINDLPPYVVKNKDVEEQPCLPMLNVACSLDVTDNHNELQTNPELDEYRIILEILYDAYKSKENIGRRKISKRAERAGFYLSEHEIRYKLNTLEKRGLAKVGIGRRGTRITQKGISTINGLNCTN